MTLYNMNILTGNHQETHGIVRYGQYNDLYNG